MSIRWFLFADIPSFLGLARSSHCCAVSSTGRLVLFSGERQPRIPVDDTIHALDLEDAKLPWGPIAARSLPQRFLPTLGHVAPEPRVGATAVLDPNTDNLYVWGGRGGVDMAPLDRFQAGVWKVALGDLDVPFASEIAWERLPAVNDDSDAAPELTSYHASALAGGKLYVHAGCPASGRLATLHAYDLATHTWQRLADAPAPPRGGTAIAAVSLPQSYEPLLVRFGGFAGVQLPQVDEGAPPPLDVYTPSTDVWSTLYPAPDPEHGFPGARSVHGLVPFTDVATPNSARAVPVALLYHGEKDASSLGHAGAGLFWDDAWVLLAAPVAPPSLQWKKLRVEGTSSGDVVPEPRGWFPCTSYVCDGKTKVVLAGGLLSSNERSAEVWIGDVEL